MNATVMPQIPVAGPRAPGTVKTAHLRGPASDVKITESDTMAEEPR